MVEYADWLVSSQQIRNPCWPKLHHWVATCLQDHSYQLETYHLLGLPNNLIQMNDTTPCGAVPISTFKGLWYL